MNLWKVGGGWGPEAVVAAVSALLVPEGVIGDVGVGVVVAVAVGYVGAGHLAGKAGCKRPRGLRQGASSRDCCYDRG